MVATDDSANRDALPDQAATVESTPGEKKEAAARRQVPGNLPYTASIGVFRRALEKIIESERPPNFNRDFMATVLGISGGASNAVIPILRKVGFVGESGVPTSLYSEFQTSSGRAEAALAGLRKGFEEIFKRNTYAHKADREKLIDAIRSITGLPKSDRIVEYIYNTFSAFQSYASGADDRPAAESHAADGAPRLDTPPLALVQPIPSTNLGLSYHINIVVPETSNIDVLNAIFRAVKENLLR